MVNFLLMRKPHSYNSWKGTSQKGQNYKNALHQALHFYNSVVEISSQNVYVLVYYFYKEYLGIDADNISKPIVDCLQDVLYANDKQVEMRIAVASDLNISSFKQIDFSRFSPQIASDLVQAFEDSLHILYIECGNYDESMLQFNLENYAN
jgi:Holliday junction resolvase RusA-like endonuclease